MPAATEVISLLEAREFVGADETRLPRLEQVILAATGYCARKLGKALLSATYVDYFDGFGTNEASLQRSPVTSVTSIHSLASAAPEEWDELNLTLYPVVILEPGRRRIAFRNTLFFRGIRNWKVTYLAGYGDVAGVAPIPDDVREAALQVVQTMWTHYDRHKDMIASITTAGPNGSTVNYFDRHLPADTIDLLNEQRKRRWN